MKIIDHVTKKEIGKFNEFVDFKPNNRFMLPSKDGKCLKFLVIDVDYSEEGSVTVFELNDRQWEKGCRIKDVLV